METTEKEQQSKKERKKKIISIIIILAIAVPSLGWAGWEWAWPQRGIIIQTLGNGETSPKASALPYFYRTGLPVTIKALPDNNSYFSGWTEDIESDKNPLTFNMPNKALLIRAIFLPKQYSLNINIVGQGTTDPANGTHKYTYGAKVKITAIESVGGWFFSHWKIGNKIVYENSTQLIIKSNINATAWFKEARTLKVNVVGDGTTIPSPGEHEYPDGSVVELQGIDGKTGIFKEWAWLNETSTQNPFNITMDSDKNVTAYFSEKFWLIMVIVYPGGTTNPKPMTYHYYPPNTEVVITAIPEPGFKLNFWQSDAIEGTISHDNPITVLMNHNWLVWVYFMPAG